MLIQSFIDDKVRQEKEIDEEDREDEYFCNHAETRNLSKKRWLNELLPGEIPWGYTKYEVRTQKAENRMLRENLFEMPRFEPLGPDFDQLIITIRTNIINEDHHGREIFKLAQWMYQQYSNQHMYTDIRKKIRMNFVNTIDVLPLELS